MKYHRDRVLRTLAATVVLTVAVTTARAVWRIAQSAELARESEPFSASPKRPIATLLMVGDSTAVGTGASSPQHSLAALIANDHPRWKIVNHAKDGAKFADIVGQLDALGSKQFDAILVLGGGNDVIRLTGHEALKRAVMRTSLLARAHADLVVIMPCGNVGNAPFFFAPLSWLMAKRSRDLHTLIREAVADIGVQYVNLYKDMNDDPFAQRSDELNAKDGLHPSDAGYRVWYSELNSQAGFSDALSALERSLGDSKR